MCGQGGCLSPLLRGWWPKVVVAPPVHVHVLVVQIAFLLFAVVARVVPPVVWVGARVAPSTSTMGTIFILDLARHLFIRQKPRFILFIMPSLGPSFWAEWGY